MVVLCLRFNTSFRGPILLCTDLELTNRIANLLMRNTVKIKPEFVPYKMRLLGQNQDLLFLILVFLHVITLSMNITYNINITYSPETTIFGLQ